MAQWTINIGNSTIFNLAKVWYEDLLDGIGNWEVCIDGADSTIRGQVIANATVSIYRDSTQVVRGVAYHVEYLQGGAILVRGFNNELELSETKCPIDSGKHTKVYTSTTANAIFSDLVTTVSGWSADVSGSTATAITAFRTSDSMSVWNGIIQLIRLTGKNIYVSRTEKKAYLTDKKGTADKFHFNEGIDVTNISYTQSKAKASKVVVYGKADGSKQIIGSSGSGTPVVEIVDRNIIKTTEANNRAAKELALIQNAIKQYSFNVFDPTINVDLGDQGKITAPSLGLFGEEVDIVAITRGITEKGIEFLELEVTNDSYRLAKIATQQHALAMVKNTQLSDTSMQGSGNLSQWSGIRNANNSVALRIPFYVNSRFEDEAGEMQIDSITVDYDIDPFNKEYGSVSEDNEDPDIDDTTRASSDNTSTEQDSAYDETTSSGTIANSWTTKKSWTNIAYHGEGMFFNIQVTIYDWDSPTNTHSVWARVKRVDDTTYFPSSTGVRLLRGPTQENTANESSHTHSGYNGYWYVMVDTGDLTEYAVINTAAGSAHNHAQYHVLNGSCTIYVPGDPYGYDYDVQLDTTDSGDATGSWFAGYSIISQHDHGDGDYKTDLHNHGVSIGDGVSDAASLNASNVTIYLDYWNIGTSAWVNKHSVTPSPASTLSYDVDISNSGTYPDATGLWRVRILTNNASADLVQAIVSIKHHMDN